MRARVLMFPGAPAVLLGERARTAETPEDAAQRAAESWLEIVDQARYEESWEQAAELLRGAVMKEQWKDASRGVRAPLGKLVSRKVKSRQYAEGLPGAPDGKYVVIQFETVFEKKSSAVETVTPMRVSGYFIR